VPKEAADPSVLDLRQVGAGSGPFYLTELIQSVSHTYKRNPEFKKDPRNLPYVDEVFFAELPDYSTQLAQLRAGRIYDSYFNFGAEDILPTKRDVPELDVQPSLIYSLIFRAFFGLAPESPFSDDRVRQAYVQTWDRDLFLGIAFNVKNFEDAGLPIETAVESGANAGTWEGYWLDPRSDAFGDSSKHFSQNLEDSRKLLEAAGHPDGVDFDLYYISSSRTQPFIEILTAMTTDSGLFRPEHKILDTPEFNANIRDNRGNFSGAGFTSDNNEPDPIVDLIAHYHSAGGRYLGGDEHMDGLLDKAATEFDAERQKALAHDIQRYEGEKHFQPRMGAGTGYRITWPALRNKGVWGGPFHSSFLRWNATVWLDETKPPLNR
jgi:peptide/nickel transport system substrate-binding protein